MIAVDTNILVYAHRAESAFHEAAFASIERLAEGAQPWGIPVACLHEFLSIATNTKIFNPASTYEQALIQVEAWLASPTVHVLHSSGQHWPVLAQLARKAKLQGGQFHDARIAALCIENGVSLLWSADRDFGRFKALKTLNPLV
jgi:uncharacterized protein